MKDSEEEFQKKAERVFGGGIQKFELGKGASVKHVIAVVSGKGGVGKSFVSSYLAVLLARKGYRVGIMDADITGPSIPYAFGLKSKAYGNEDNMILPGASAKENIQIISSNMMLDDETQPIVWRGAMIASMVQQFWSQTLWEYLDYLIIDCPPGTGDVPLTIFQSIPVDGIVVATSPQGLVSMVVEKAANMANMMNVPILGLVSNMSYVICPHCGEKIEIYGKDHLEELQEQYQIPCAVRVPFDQNIAAYTDEGAIENLEVSYLDPLADEIAKLEPGVKSDL